MLKSVNGNPILHQSAHIIIMRIIFIAFILSGLTISSCFKLRKDIGKVRYYCTEICKGCGGQPIIKDDFCFCFDEKADFTETNKCLENTGTKLNFLGIKWKLGHSSDYKKALNSDNLATANNDQFQQPKLEKNYLTKTLQKKLENIINDFPSGKNEVISEEGNFNEHKKSEIRKKRSLETYRLYDYVVGHPTTGEENFQFFATPEHQLYYNDRRNSEAKKSQYNVDSDEIINLRDVGDRDCKNEINLTKLLTDGWKYFRIYFSA